MFTISKNCKVLFIWGKKLYLEQEGSYQILVKWKLTHSLLVQAGLYKQHE